MLQVREAASEHIPAMCQLLKQLFGLEQDFIEKNHTEKTQNRLGNDFKPTG
jgi:hypothetical protein